MNRMHSAARLFLGGMSIAAATTLTPLAPVASLAAPPPQISPEDAALIKLNAGRRAFNAKQYPAAINAFKEFVAGFPNSREAGSAWYGMGLCLMQSAPPDYVAAADAFQKSAAAPAFTD